MEKYSKGSGIMGSIQWQSVALGAGVGIAATIIFMLLMAAVLASVDMSEGAPAVISTLCMGAGAVLGGFVAAKRNGRNGLIVGLVSGAAMFVLFALVALALGSDVGGAFVVRFAVSVFFAAVGGVLGINLRRKRRYV